jgi:hypothetical protein
MVRKPDVQEILGVRASDARRRRVQISTPLMFALLPGCRRRQGVIAQTGFSLPAAGKERPPSIQTIGL